MKIFCFLIITTFVLSCGTAIVAQTNSNEIFQQLLIRAQQGDAEAQCKIGEMYDQGDGVVQNFAEAKKWLRRAAEQGHAQAQAHLGNIYRLGAAGEQENFAEALIWYRKAAEQRHLGAMNDIGQMYMWGGNRLKRDRQEAVRWYRKAAELGWPFSQFNLGMAYGKGKGVKKDKNEAEKWLRLSVQHPEATPIMMNEVGLAFYHGKKVPRNYNEAAFWFYLAAQQGLPGAQLNIAHMYKKGLGVPKNAEAAKEWNRLGREQMRLYRQELFNPQLPPVDLAQALAAFADAMNITANMIADIQQKRSGGAAASVIGGNALPQVLSANVSNDVSCPCGYAEVSTYNRIYFDDVSRLISMNVRHETDYNENERRRIQANMKRTREEFNRRCECLGIQMDKSDWEDWNGRKR